MSATRKPSVSRTLRALAKKGLSARVTYPDGTVIEVLTGALTPQPISPPVENPWDSLFNGNAGS